MSDDGKEVAFEKPAGMRVMTDAECLKTFESKLVPELNRLLERKIDTSVSQTDLRN